MKGVNKAKSNINITRMGAFITTVVNFSGGKQRYVIKMNKAHI